MRRFRLKRHKPQKVRIGYSDKMFNLKKYAQEVSLPEQAQSIFYQGGLKDLDRQFDDATDKIDDETNKNINTTQEAKETFENKEQQEFLPIYEGVELLMLFKDDTDIDDRQKDILIGRLRSAHKVSDQSLDFFRALQKGEVQPNVLAVDQTAKSLARTKYENGVKQDLMSAAKDLQRMQDSRYVAFNMKK